VHKTLTFARSGRGHGKQL